MEQTLVLSGNSVSLRGHLALLSHRGVQPLRLPASARHLFPPASALLETVTSMAAGVRVVFRTSANRVDLEVRCTQVRIDGGAPLESLFELEIEGSEVRTSIAPVNRILHVPSGPGDSRLEIVSDPSHVVFDALGTRAKSMAIWLPHTMLVEVVDMTADAPVVRPWPNNDALWLHHGSSISHCAESPSPTGAWPSRTAKSSGLDLTNLGFMGQCMLDPFVADAIAATNADVISLEVGINIVAARSMDQRTFVPALHGFLDRIRSGHPLTPIVVTSAILWPGSEHAPGPSEVMTVDGKPHVYAGGRTADVTRGALTLSESRSQIERVVAARASRGDQVLYLNGLELYGPSDTDEYDLVDNLHPTPTLYAEIGRRFAELVFGPRGLVPRHSLGRADK